MDEERETEKSKKLKSCGLRNAGYAGWLSLPASIPLRKLIQLQLSLRKSIRNSAEDLPFKEPQQVS